MKKILSLLVMMMLSNASFAERFWTNEMEGWDLVLNNGVAYVQHPSFPPACRYSRAQINFSNDEYMKAIWAYVLAASKSKEKLKVVLDHDRNAAPDTVTCVILSAYSTS